MIIRRGTVAPECFWLSVASHTRGRLPKIPKLDSTADALNALRGEL